VLTTGPQSSVLESIELLFKISGRLTSYFYRLYAEDICVCDHALELKAQTVLFDADNTMGAASLWSCSRIACFYLLGT